jgi:predicted CXXCH cytochrome family protein
MDTSTTHWRRSGWRAFAIGTALVATTLGVAAASRSQNAPPQASPDSYVGDDTCLTCHEGQGYKGTAHGRSANPRTPAAVQGCESCHGAGKAHVDGEGDKTKIVNPKNLGAREASDTCTTCHNRKTHALWDGSQHDSRQVGCVSCHSVHAPVGDKQLKAKDEVTLCGTCHKGMVNKQFRFNHMPVREGKMSCSSCHNVHGSTNVKLLKADDDRRELLPASAVVLWGTPWPRLHDVPRRARVEQRPHAHRQAAVPLPALPCDLAASSHGL